jgi:hypothetical protein
MTFLVGIESPARGSYTLGYLNAPDKQSAQNAVVTALVDIGFPMERIGIQVSDNSSLEIGLHRVIVVPIREFDSQMTSTLAALL